MILIVRFGAGIAFFLAAGGVVDILLFLWRQRSDFSNVGVGGLGNSVILIGVLSLIGYLLWKNSKRLGPWLCSEPGRKRRAPQAETLRRSRDETE
ncbi:MAG TPA: hypothetical protein VGH65_11295 [Verrucomicrobiaceae bacterium]